MSEAERFWGKVEFTDSCWLWTASRDTSGYGQFRRPGRLVMAHRYAYEFCVGPIPEGLTLDHLCRVRHCVNPDDLEPVTMRENILRGERGRVRRENTHCPKGHEYTPANTYRWAARPDWRRCRECSRLWKQRRRREGTLKEIHHG